MQNVDSQITMLEHSEAKVALYGRYLSTYLNILGRALSCKKIRIFDLMCGEGIYLNQGKGSPVIALNAVKNHCYANPELQTSIELWFNDNGESQISPGTLKTDRVRAYAETLSLPPRVGIHYFCDDYEQVQEQANTVVQAERYTKALHFIDPYGYKAITPERIERVLANGKSEALLFLPVSFMYRFAEKAVSEDFPGSMPLRKFLFELYGGQPPTFASAYDFVIKITAQFRSYLTPLGAFVDSFTLDRGQGNLFSLFFFTCNKKGYQKMVEAKWQEDSQNGTGFSSERIDNSQQTLFSVAELRGYPDELRQFMLNGPCSNEEISDFGYTHGFLPKHTKRVLEEWLDRGCNLIILSQDGKPIRKGATYVGNVNRNVTIELTQ